MVCKLSTDAQEIKAAEELLYEVLFKPLQMDRSARQQLKIPGKDYHFVCMEENEVAGVMLVVQNQDYWELRHAAVSDSHRSKGIGRKLWNEVARYLDEADVKSIELLSRNTALGFWSSMGFEEISDWIDHDFFAAHQIQFKRMRRTRA